MLMKGDDVYLMNVGDSRAILSQKPEPNVWGSLGKDHLDLERINEETLHDLESLDADPFEQLPSLSALQLSVDHSTNVEEEVQRIRNEHPNDASSVVNDRVKGSLKVTRAFGAGFLKQVSADGISYHKACFNYNHCKGALKLEGGVMGAALSVNLSWWLLSMAMFVYVLFGVCPLTWHGFSIDAFFGRSDFLKVSIVADLMLCFQPNMEISPMGMHHMMTTSPWLIRLWMPAGIKKS